MTPLRITARLGAPVRLPHGWLSLDSLLASAICTRDNEPPLFAGDDPVDFGPRLDAALQRSECGRLWLASWSIGEPDGHEKRWANRRPPIAEAQALGGASVKTVNVAAGPMKAFHKPTEAVHFRDDRLDWYAVGDAGVIWSLLSLIRHLGAKRNAGDGSVLKWEVVECEAWAPGFPVVLNGAPLRPLPLDWPGLDLDACGQDSMALRPPYWPHDPRQKVPVAVPLR